MHNAQLNKLKSEVKSGTEVSLNLPSNVIGDPNKEANFTCKLLLTNTNVSKICKTFANNSSANMKFLKTQLSEIVQLEGNLGRRLGPLLKSGLPSVLKPLAKSVLIPLGLTDAASATDAVIHKKIFGSWRTALTISNNELNDTMKIVKYIHESGIIIKRCYQSN